MLLLLMLHIFCVHIVFFVVALVGGGVFDDVGGGGVFDVVGVCHVVVGGVDVPYFLCF